MAAEAAALEVSLLELRFAGFDTASRRALQ